MKTYLISGIFTFSDGETRPFVSTQTLGPSGCMDFQTLTYVEALALEHQNRHGTIAQLAQVHSFQQLETAPPVPPAEAPPEEVSLHHRWVEEVRMLRDTLDQLGVPVHFEGVIPTVTRLLQNQAELNLAVHLNDCSVVMPPVDSPLLIEIAPGVLLRASRDAHAESRNDLLRFRLDHGGFYTGRPRWTHP